jgi:hypothetical protein
MERSLSLIKGIPSNGELMGKWDGVEEAELLQERRVPRKILQFIITPLHVYPGEMLQP